MTLATQDSPQRRAVARYILRADLLFRKVARTTDPDEWIRLIEAANVARKGARDELYVPWLKR